MSALDRYTETFGNPKKTIENLPYQLTVECYRNPFFLEEDERLEDLFSVCVQRGTAFTEREFVDCLYLEDGMYSFEDVSETNYETFIERVQKIDADY